MDIGKEIRRTPEGRYFHRLHAVLLSQRGLTPAQVAELFGVSLRTVQHWLRKFNQHGPAGLQEEERPGRPPLLSPRQQKEIEHAIRGTLSWAARFPDFRLQGRLISQGTTLSKLIAKVYKLELSPRQCQRLLDDLGVIRTHSGYGGIAIINDGKLPTRADFLGAQRFWRRAGWHRGGLHGPGSGGDGS